MSDQTVYAFEVSVKGMDWARIINERTSGRAKSRYFMFLQDCWLEIPFTAIRCRKVGAPQSSEEFVRNAKYRGLPDVRCGDRVVCDGGAHGVIVGHNSSANFDVLFDDDSSFRGAVLNVHPQSCRILRKDHP